MKTVINKLNKENLTLEGVKDYSYNELMSIKGIGSKSADKIIDYFKAQEPRSIKYTFANKELTKVEYTEALNEECMNVFTPKLIKDIIAELNQQLIDSCDVHDYLSSKIDINRLNPFVSENDYNKQLKELDFNVEDRKIAWRYRKISIRDIQIEAILYASKKKLPKRISNVLKALYEGFVRTGKEQISLGAVLNSVTKALELKNEFKCSITDSMLELDKEAKDSIGFQLILSLSEIGLINMFISDKTHMIKWVDEMAKEFNEEIFDKLVANNKFLKSKTVYTDKVYNDWDKMLSQSSWYYKTPVLSNELKAYFDIVQGIKYKFKEFTGDEFIAAYKAHCDIKEIRDYDKPRINHLWDQIEASRQNGGHYVQCMGDSVWRNYMMAEFGHFQTSHAFRDLVSVEGINNPIKYDATNSVLQMYSLALKSGNMAQYVGLLENKTGDFRTIIADKLNEQFNTNVFDKDGIKPVFMIWAYNAGKDRILNGSPKLITDPFDGSVTLDYKNRSKGLLSIAEGVNYGTEDKLYNAFISILEQLVPEIFFLKSIFKKLVKGNQKEIYSWTLPDGAIAQYANVTKREQDRELMESIAEAIDEDGDRHQHTIYTKYLKKSASLAGLLPRVIHSIDAYIQRQIVVRAHALGIVVVPNHDSFMFDEKYKTVMFNLIKTVYADVMEAKVLQNIVRELNENKVDLTVNLLPGEGRLYKALVAKQPSLAKLTKIPLTAESFYVLFPKFGKLTRENIMAGAPVEEEEI